MRKLATLPADNLSLTDRGRLKPGAFADMVVFDPNTIQDHATYEKPHQLSTGVSYVIVNGQIRRQGRSADRRCVGTHSARPCVDTAPRGGAGAGGGLVLVKGPAAH